MEGPQECSGTVVENWLANFVLCRQPFSVGQVPTPPVVVVEGEGEEKGVSARSCTEASRNLHHPMPTGGKVRGCFFPSV